MRIMKTHLTLMRMMIVLIQIIVANKVLMTQTIHNASVLERIKASLVYKTYQELALKKVFNDFDADNNKYIDAMELRLMTCDYEDGTEIYQSLTQEDAELYLELVDVTGDKLLDENQFVFVYDGMLKVQYPYSMQEVWWWT